MTLAVVIRLFLIVALSFTCLQYVTAQGRGAGGSGNAGNQKLREEVEFLKANLSALWDVVSALQTRAAQERQDESDELIISLGLKKTDTWGPSFKNIFDSQIRVRAQDESKSSPAMSSSYALYKGKDYTTWRRVKNTDEIYFWHRGTTLLLHLLKPDGSVQQLKLGDPLQDADAAPQQIVAPGIWVAAELEDKYSYCLLSIAKAPGFEASKLEMGQPDVLVSRYPQSEGLVNRLSPPRSLPTSVAGLDGDSDE